jgi:hypothetical protein
MPRRNHKNKTRLREHEEVEYVTFAQLMESRHILPSRTTSTGRKVWTVHTGG